MNYMNVNDPMFILNLVKKDFMPDEQMQVDLYLQPYFSYQPLFGSIVL